MITLKFFFADSNYFPNLCGVHGSINDKVFAPKNKPPSVLKIVKLGVGYMVTPVFWVGFLTFCLSNLTMILGTNVVNDLIVKSNLVGVRYF